MRNSIITLSMVTTVVLLESDSALAIQHGELDGNRHPYVGLMIAQDADGDVLWRCSGTLLGPELFLTAGHCVEPPAAHIEIWFDADVQSGIPQNGYPNDGDVSGTPYLHPDYDPDAFYLFDLGVVVLDEPIEMNEYGVLPTENQLDVLARKRGLQNVWFTAVGYGLQRINPVFEENQRVRMFAEPRLIQINNGDVGDYSLLLSNNHSTGGICFGDSGGPNFIDSTNVIAGVTSFLFNGNCAGTGGVYRVDRDDALDWLHDDFGDYLP